MVAVHEVTQLISQAHDRAAVSATQALRAHASRSGWPLNITRSLKVVHDNGTMRVDYPHYLADDIENLEYGTSDTPPSAVLRSFGNRLDQHANLESHLDEHLRGIL